MRTIEGFAQRVAAGETAERVASWGDDAALFFYMQRACELASKIALKGLLS